MKCCFSHLLNLTDPDFGHDVRTQFDFISVLYRQPIVPTNLQCHFYVTSGFMSKLSFSNISLSILVQTILGYCSFMKCVDLSRACPLTSFLNNVLATLASVLSYTVYNQFVKMHEEPSRLRFEITWTPIKVCISMDEWDPHLGHLYCFFCIRQLALVTPTEKAQHFNGLTQWRFIPAQVKSPAGQAATLLTGQQLEPMVSKITWKEKRELEETGFWMTLLRQSLAVTHLTPHPCSRHLAPK